VDGGSEHAGRSTPRVPPHVLRAVGPARHVLLDFDGVMFDVETALGPEARVRAVLQLLARRPYWPRPLTFGAFGVHHMLDFITEHKPDHATEAEKLIANLELDAALTAQPSRDLRELLAACAATDRKVAVISDLSEDAVVAALRACALDAHIDAVAARRGLELSAFDAGYTAERAADLLGEPLGSCLVVSGRWARIRAAQDAGAIGLGCECGHESRKHLATPQIPVVSNLATLSQALYTR
jgi:beta-phosphoglucomutase-like phosphatase (HAD superfamily)